MIVVMLNIAANPIVIIQVGNSKWTESVRNQRT